METQKELKISGTVVIVIVLILAYFFSGDTDRSHYDDNNIDIVHGQVWVYEFGDAENPFEEVRRDTVVVLDVIGDYVLYSQRGCTFNGTKDYFLLGSRRIK